MPDNYRKFFWTHIWAIVASLGFVLAGVALVFTAQETDNPGGAYFAGLLSIVFFGFCGITLTYQLLKRPQQAYRAREKLLTHPIWGNLAYPIEQDLSVISFIKTRPVFLVPFLISTLLIFAFWVFEFGTFIIADRIERIFDFYLLGVSLYVYTLSFISFSIYILGYLATGELLQRAVSKAKRGFMADLLIGYLTAIPFVAVLSLLWIILLFISDEQRRRPLPSKVSGLVQTVWYMLFVGFKYYTYINLAMISFGDAQLRPSMGSAYEFFKKERANLFWIWFRSGLLVAMAFFFGFSIFMLNEKFHFMNEAIAVLIGLLSLIVPIFFGLFSEQISFLLYYIKTRHPEVDLRSLTLNTQPKRFNL